MLWGNLVVCCKALPSPGSHIAIDAESAVLDSVHVYGRGYMMR